MGNITTVVTIQMDSEDKEKIAAIQRKVLEEQIRRKRNQPPEPGRARIQGIDYNPFWRRIAEWVLYIFAHGVLVILPFFLFFSVLLIFVFIDSYFWQITIALPIVLGSYALYRMSRKPLSFRDRHNEIDSMLSHYNNQQALSDLHDLAKEGYIPAQLHVGGMYQSAKQVTRNAKTAMKWYRRAAERGSAEAHFRLANLMADGAEGVDKDVSSAIQHYEKAYKSGFADAAFSLAQIYEHGKGVDSDREKAIEWYFESGKLYEKTRRPADLEMEIRSLSGIEGGHQLAIELQELNS